VDYCVFGAGKLVLGLGAEMNKKLCGFVAWWRFEFLKAVGKRFLM
jgi:hypothetical protein